MTDITIDLVGPGAEISLAAATRSEAAAATAEARADLAGDYLVSVAAGLTIYESASAGNGAVSNGDYFFVAAAGSSFLDLYRKVAGSPVYQKSSYSTALLPTYAGAYSTLADAITAAGENGTLVLERDAEYEISSGLTTLAGQIIIGNGATIKRRNQISTTTTTAMADGVDDAVTLTSVSGLAVGMQVAFAQQGVARSALVYEGTGTPVTLSHVRTITDITGSTITLDQAINADLSIGATCFLTFTCLTLASGAQATGIRFDGNRSNFTYARWEVTSEISTLSATADQVIRSCTFVNSPGEAILPYGDNQTIDDCRFDTIGGNAIHLSGVVKASITNNKGTNGNIDTSVSHADGFISFSNGNSRIIITGNVADTFISGVGAINETDSDVTVADNDFEDMYCFGIEGGGATEGLVITGNRINGVGSNTAKKSGIPYYGGIVMVGLSASGYTISNNHVTGVASGERALAISQTSASTGCRISGNYLDGSVELVSMYEQDFIGNTVVGTVTLGGAAMRGRIEGNNITASTSVTRALGLTATAAYTDLIIAGNEIEGGIYGIGLPASATAYAGIVIERNRLTGQVQRGFDIPASSATIDGFAICDNLVRVGSGADASFLGAVIGLDGITFARNRATNAVGSGSRTGFYFTKASAPDLVVTDNEVRGAWANSILLTESAGCYAKDNIVDGVAIGGSTGNTVSGTITL